jgi:hypothetical protein
MIETFRFARKSLSIFVFIFSFVLCKKKKEREKKVAQSIILRVFFVAFLLYCESAICGVEHAEVTVKKKTIQQVCMQKVFHFVSL